MIRFIESKETTDLGADNLETLYNLRHIAIHGALDFLQEQDNGVARAGYDLLDSLIRNVRDRW